MTKSSRPTGDRGRVSYCPEGVRVEPSDTGDLHLDIHQYTQAWLGEPSLADLLDHGFVSAF